MNPKAPIIRRGALCPLSRTRISVGVDLLLNKCRHHLDFIDMFDLAQLPSVHVCHVRLEMLVIYDTIYLIFLSQKFALDSSGFTETAFPKSWLNLEMKPLNKTKKNDCGVVIFLFFFIFFSSETGP